MEHPDFGAWLAACVQCRPVAWGWRRATCYWNDKAFSKSSSTLSCKMTSRPGTMIFNRSSSIRPALDGKSRSLLQIFPLCIQLFMLIQGPCQPALYNTCSLSLMASAQEDYRADSLRKCFSPISCSLGNIQTRAHMMAVKSGLQIHAAEKEKKKKNHCISPNGPEDPKPGTVSDSVYFSSLWNKDCSCSSAQNGVFFSGKTRNPKPGFK